MRNFMEQKCLELEGLGRLERANKVWFIALLVSIISQLMFHLRERVDLSSVLKFTRHPFQQT